MTRITIKKFLPYHKLTWSRLAVDGDLRSIYIFTDNTDRTSGSGPIDPNSWYCKEFGEGKNSQRELQHALEDVTMHSQSQHKNTINIIMIINLIDGKTVI